VEGPIHGKPRAAMPVGFSFAAMLDTEPVSGPGSAVADDTGNRRCIVLAMLLCRLTAVSLVSVLVMAGPVLAQSPAPATSPGEQHDPTWTSSSGLAFALFPAGDIFPVYVADPHRPTIAIVSHFYNRQEIPNSGSPRMWLSAGGRFGLLRIDSGSPGARSWQVSFDAGLDAVFDTEYRSDLIGLDGNYGLTLTTASDDPWAVKVGLLHVSAHLGDEYIERTGAKRINYHREELAIGAAWRFSPRWRGYGELAGAYLLAFDQQEPLRLQGGLEYESVPRLWGGRFAWYSAADLQSWQERSWRVDTTVQAGIVTRANGRTYRLLLEYLDGRPRIGEFFKETESSLAFGLRIEP
jgi:hypothetical protein